MALDKDDDSADQCLIDHLDSALNEDHELSLGDELESVPDRKRHKTENNEDDQLHIEAVQPISLVDTPVYSDNLKGRLQ